MKPNTSLFLQQSYLEAWDTYVSSLKKYNFIHWDFVILTASNDEQAQSYKMQINQRLDGGYLPKLTHYAVVPDPQGKRIGSGGATLNVLKYISENVDNSNIFENKRILVIHSGGDSKRVPQYSTCGKLFSPVPRLLPDGRRSTLFDEFIITMSGTPSRMKDGMLVLSGDVLLIFNPLQIDFNFGGVAAISIKEGVETGKNHGVYLGDGNGYVKNFYHKLSTEKLTAYGAVNERNQVDIDTGAVLLSSDVLESMFSLVSDSNIINRELFAKFVNDDVALSFYGDFLYPLATDSTKEGYQQEKSEGNASDSLRSCRDAIWAALSQYNMRLFNLSPAIFTHFGTTKELRKLLTEKVDDFQFLDWKKKIIVNENAFGNFACNSSFIESCAKVCDNCYIEDSIILGESKIENGSVASNVELEAVNVPQNTVLHGVKLQNGKFVVRVYGVNDNPKFALSENASLLGVPFDDFAQILGANNLWQTQPFDIWTANLFSVCETMKEAVDSSLRLVDIANGDLTFLEKWRKMPRMSLSSSFNECDTKHLLFWQKEIGQKIALQNFLYCVDERRPSEKVLEYFGRDGISKQQIEQLEAIAQSSQLDRKIRIYYYISKLATKNSSDSDPEYFENLCFQEIRRSMLDYATAGICYNKSAKIQKACVNICLPLRINWGGGWSDTPPYCIENGGTVLNAAIKVNDRFPVEVSIKKLDELKLVFECADAGVKDEFTDIDTARDNNNPFDSFALHKAVLLACGVLPLSGDETLSKILDRLGGGIYISTQVIGIPRGSGLGTSSILSGACVKALYEFLGSEISSDDLYNKVMCVEQIMSTGGGWQDQIGGIEPGIKLISTNKGIKQEFKIDAVELSAETKQELQDRFALIYTGQRRLARNLLREVVGRYIGGNVDSISALYEIQRLAVVMRFELGKGNIDAFSELLNRHWVLSKQLDYNCTNTCIEQIFSSCGHLIDGKMICGAGGGGFLQVILKVGVTRQELSEALRSVFGESGVDVWECEVVY